MSNRQLALTTKPKKLGRSRLLTAALQKRICNLLSKGNTIITTCDAVGISESAYYDWREKNKQFSEATSRARGDARIKLVKVLTDASKIDWRAAGWLLSHCWPAEFSEMSRSEVALAGRIIFIPAKAEGDE
jgi:hypothetical protein